MAHQSGTSIVSMIATRRISRIWQGLFLPEAERSAKELGRLPSELLPERGNPVQDGAATLRAKNLFYAHVFRGVLLVLDAFDPLIATNAIEGGWLP